jgi:hypothetical protein
MRLVRALLASRCREGLEAVTIHEHISIAAAAELLQGLPELKNADLSVSNSLPGQQRGGKQVTGRTDASVASSTSPSPWLNGTALPQLESLNIQGHGSVEVDAGSLRCAANLEDLTLRDCMLPCWASMAALTSLRALTIELTGTAMDGYCTRLDWLSSLQHLETLDLPDAVCQGSDWPALANLPRLDYLRLHTLTIMAEPPGGDAHQCQGRRSLISCLQIVGRLVMEAPGTELPGFLARQLPFLQELSTWSCSLAGLAEALQGHPALELLLVQTPDGGPTESEWRRQLLRKLPVLQELTLFETKLDPCTLLHDLAGCGALQCVHITSPEDVQPQRAGVGALAALAAGAAADSLQQIWVDSCVFGVDEVAALLTGSMPQLHRLEVAVRVPKELTSQDAVLKALPGLLLQHGATKPVQCLACHNLQHEQGCVFASVVLKLDGGSCM